MTRIGHLHRQKVCFIFHYLSIQISQNFFFIWNFKILKTPLLPTPTFEIFLLRLSDISLPCVSDPWAGVSWSPAEMFRRWELLFVLCILSQLPRNQWGFTDCTLGEIGRRYKCVMLWLDTCNLIYVSWEVLSESFTPYKAINTAQLSQGALLAAELQQTIFNSPPRHYWRPLHQKSISS